MRFLMAAGLASAVFSLAGCGPGGPELAPVEGTVTVDGKPVPNANLTFVPDRPDGSPSYGKTDAEGHYTLDFTRDKKGAMIGTHTVQIEVSKMSKADIAEARAGGEEVPDVTVEIPKRPKDAEPLTAEVKSDDNVIDFELGAGK